MSPGPARAVAVVEREGRILVILRRRGTEEYAVLPGGGVDPGETPEQAVLRELAEECGFTGTIERALLEADHGGRHATYFHVVGTAGEPVLGGVEALLNSEHNHYRPVWVMPEDLPAIGLRPAEVLTSLLDALWPVEVRQVEDQEWPILEWLWQAYRNDMAHLIAGSAPYPDGRYSHGPLDAHPGSSHHTGYLAWRHHPQAGRPAPVGFALVSGVGEAVRSITSFWTAPVARRTGLGRRLALDVLGRHPDPWEIAFQHENVVAGHFWRTVARDVWGSQWTEEQRPVPGRPQLPPDHWISTT